MESKKCLKIINKLLKSTGFCICNIKLLEKEFKMKENQIENLRKRINQMYYGN